MTIFPGNFFSGGSLANRGSRCYLNTGCLQLEKHVDAEVKMRKAGWSVMAAAFLLGAAAAEMSDAELRELGPVRQNCFTHCKVDFAPGPKYRTSKREWQGCPTLLRTPKGTLYAGWYSGGPGEGLLNYSLMVRSTDGGITWTREPLLVIDSLTEQKIQSLDIQFWLDPQGRFWFFWTQRDYNYPQRHPRHLSVWAIVCDDPDAPELKWSEPRFITPGFVRTRPTVLKDGRWILCAYDWTDEYYRYSESFDRGRTWFRRRAGKKYPGNTTAFDESMVLERKDGTLWFLARTLKKIGFLVECTSGDGGKTWTDGKLSAIPNPSSRFFILRLQSGKILMVNNWEGNDRYHLTAALSEDDGKTWPHKMLLDPRRCTYPDVVEGAPGEFFIIHDFGRGDYKEILLSRLTERDIITGLRRGALANENSFLQHIINKAPRKADLTPEERALSDRFRRPEARQQARPLVELSGRSAGNELTQVAADAGFKVSLLADSDYRIEAEKDAGRDWRPYSFSFTAKSSKVVLTLRARGWVQYDDFQVENGVLYNPSFETVNSDGEIDGWRYYAQGAAVLNREDAAEGKNCINCGSALPARRILVCEPGKTVKVTFKARRGFPMERPDVPWTSSGERKVE